MLDALFEYFNNLFGYTLNLDIEYKINQAVVNIGGVDFKLSQWLAVTCSYVCLIIIFVLCCLFVYKIIKLIGGLIR